MQLYIVISRIAKGTNPETDSSTEGNVSGYSEMIQLQHTGYSTEPRHYIYIYIGYSEMIQLQHSGYSTKPGQMIKDSKHTHT